MKLNLWPKHHNYIHNRVYPSATRNSPLSPYSGVLYLKFSPGIFYKFLDLALMVLYQLESLNVDDYNLTYIQKKNRGFANFLTTTPLKLHHFLYTKCGDPQARPDPVGESEPKPRGRSVEVINQIPFVSVLLNFSFKSVATRNPDLTRLADPSRSPVYSDISIILSKHLVYFIHFKSCKFRGSNSFWQAHKTFTINERFTTVTFNKMPLQKY